MGAEQCTLCGAIVRVYSGAGRRHDCPGRPLDKPDTSGYTVATDQGNDVATIVNKQLYVLVTAAGEFLTLEAMTWAAFHDTLANRRAFRATSRSKRGASGPEFFVLTNQVVAYREVVW